ncbi:hypothetical protein AURDEDRAFT_172763 [Auricularia subglabra TFB-10046 SS5]|nr:hypothetical protein AURDEDRAFT_172763 [Auricularia subglabra TFB-10046 SS5]
MLASVWFLIIVLCSHATYAVAGRGGPPRKPGPPAKNVGSRPVVPFVPDIQIFDSDEDETAAPSSGEVYVLPNRRAPAPAASRPRTRSNGITPSSGSVSAPSNGPNNHTFVLPQVPVDPPALDAHAHTDPPLPPNTPESLGRVHLALNEQPPNGDLYALAAAPPTVPNHDTGDRALGRTLHPQFIFDENARAARFDELVDIIDHTLHRLESETNAHYVFLFGRPEVDPSRPGYDLARSLPSRSILAQTQLTDTSARLLTDFTNGIVGIRRSDHAAFLQRGHDDVSARLARERDAARLVQRRDTARVAAEANNQAAGASGSSGVAARIKKRKRSPSDSEPPVVVKRERTHSPEIPGAAAVHGDTVDLTAGNADDEDEGAGKVSRKRKGKERADPSPGDGLTTPQSQVRQGLAREPDMHDGPSGQHRRAAAGSSRSRAPSQANSQRARSRSASASQALDPDAVQAAQLERARVNSLETLRQEEEKRRRLERAASTSGSGAGPVPDDLTPRPSRRPAVQLHVEVTEFLDVLPIPSGRWFAIEIIWRGAQPLDYVHELETLFEGLGINIPEEDIDCLAALLVRYRPT